MLSIVNLALIVCLALAVERCTRFVIKDTLWAEMRRNLHGRIIGDTATDESGWRSRLFELITCPYCLSIWFAAIAVALADIFVSVPLPALAWLSVAGLHQVIWRYVEG